MKRIMLVLVLLSFGISTHAQTGEIKGKVTNVQTGIGIKAADIMIVDGAGAPTGKGAKTDADGNYTITSLRPGRYYVQYSCKGFISKILKGMVVSADRAIFQNIQLSPEPKKEEK